MRVNRGWSGETEEVAPRNAVCRERARQPEEPFKKEEISFYISYFFVYFYIKSKKITKINEFLDAMGVYYNTYIDLLTELGMENFSIDIDL